MTDNKKQQDPSARACELVGRFLYRFSRVELQLDDAITKLFKLDPNSAPIVTTNIDFIRKTYIVQSAISYQRAKSGKSSDIDVDKTFSDIRTQNDTGRLVV